MTNFLIIVAIVAAVFFAFRLWLNRALKPISSTSLDFTMKDINEQLFDQNW